MEDQTQRKAVRSSAILTTSYVAGTLIENTRKHDDLIILADFTKGSLTSCEIKVETTDKLYYDLAYDGQTANFTVGKTVTGAQSGAKGVIIKDTDGGATGTLVIDRVNNIDFLDNEPITDDNGTPGTAVVNGTLSVSSHTFYLVTGTVDDPSGTQEMETTDPITISATGKYRFKLHDIDRYVLISAKGTGTVTNSLLGIEAILGC